MTKIHLLFVSIFSIFLACGDELYPFNQTFYMIFNVAVGGNWPGRPDDTTVFPQQMEIDYIRYFKQK